MARGETAYRIARRYGVTVEALAALVDAGTPLNLGLRQGAWVHVSAPAVAEAHRFVGVPNLPRTSFALFRAGTSVAPGDLRPGDGQFIHGSSGAPGRKLALTLDAGRAM